MKLINFLKPINLFGKIGLTLYFGGAIAYIIVFIYFWNNPSNNFYFQAIINLTFWLIGVIGMIIYITHLVKRKA
ncbi:hypothetical protein [Bacillus sp. MRMR6]|uniref:hypothetical protein n=1 Tax=Bacillus sp. MRMR6 TaxID=1928617 RepID=UPI000952388E|nr:hypothetical protein [Bacillus sp. MRMR6]OLS38589.1 hypothetical protein BTR25_14320 [Bacillus sp. MRMR6]